MLGLVINIVPEWSRIGEGDAIISISNDLAQVTNSKTLYGGDMMAAARLLRQMALKIRARRKYQTLRIDAARRGLAPQIGARVRIVFEQPQHAAGHVVEQPHPDFEKCGRDLVIVVETAKHEGAFGQSAFHARRRRPHRSAPGVGDLIAVRRVSKIGRAHV